jgi:hypothetical protein
MNSATRQTFWAMVALMVLFALRCFRGGDASALWLVGAVVSAAVAWRFRPTTWNDSETRRDSVSLREANVPRPPNTTTAADPNEVRDTTPSGTPPLPAQSPLPPAWTKPAPPVASATTMSATSPDRTMGTTALCFWVASPVLGLLVSFLFAVSGLGDAAAASLFAALGGALIAVGAILNRDGVPGATKTLLALVYMGAVAFVLFFGGWGAMMVARGGG